MKIYFAGPLFTQAELDYNLKVATDLREIGYDVYLPQELDAKPTEIEKIFDACTSNIDSCDIVVAVLDGSDVDSGTAVEVGYAYAKSIFIIGLRTDIREGNGDEHGMNLMLSRCCHKIFTDSGKLIEYFRTTYNEGSFLR